MKFSFHVLGDSHSKYFFADKRSNGLKRMGFDPERLDITGRAIEAASVMGFRPQQSALDTKEIITDASRKTEILVLSFGQVDLELGYYYRLAVKREVDLTPPDFVAQLLDIYFAFLDGVANGGARIVLKGVNLTVLGEPVYTRRYVRRIVMKSKSGPKQEEMKILSAALQSQDQQNAMHIAFNAGLRARATETGYGYFDLVDQLADPTHPKAPRLDPRFIPGRFDHHVANSLHMQKIHILGIFEALGLNPSDAMRRR